eukprot:SAG22_NODE_4759_length_1172_cov_1.402610_3_plen_183_part_01
MLLNNRKERRPAAAEKLKLEERKRSVAKLMEVTVTDLGHDRRLRRRPGLHRLALLAEPQRLDRLDCVPRLGRRRHHLQGQTGRQRDRRQGKALSDTILGILGGEQGKTVPLQRTTTVRALPPSASASSWVSLCSRYGTTTGRVSSTAFLFSPPPAARMLADSGGGGDPGSAAPGATATAAAVA